MAETAPKAADAKALELKYTYKGADDDEKAIKKVEDAIKARFGDGGFEKGVASVKDAPVKESDIADKKKEYAEKIEQAKKDHPDEAKKEGPPPPLESGPPAKPQVAKPDVKPAGKPAVKPKAAGGGAPHAGHHVEKPKVSSTPPPAPAPAPDLVLLATVATGDAGIDNFLNSYPAKSHETTGKLSKIDQMMTISKSFDAQVESYVSKGGAVEWAKGKAIDFLGKKELGAIFGTNPYDKLQDGVGRFMAGMSRFQNVVSIVGNICSKLGMFLTVVGLLGMIFPPVGAAVEAIARVLNIIGIVCDGIGFAIGAVLTALNGVELARQIAKGGSNEEKAATADMMMTEASSAGSHALSLALTYGGKFMEGMKGASKGFIANVTKRFKSTVGKIAAKTLGPAKNWAKKALYKVGIGLEEGKLGGLAKKAWAMPGKGIDKLKNASWVKKLNASKFSQGAERFAGKLDNMSLFHDGIAERMEGAGQALANAGEKGSWTKKLQQGVKNDEHAAERAAEQTAAEDAANRERAKIDREISKKRDAGNAKYEESTAGGHGVVDEDAALESRQLYDDADKLEKKRDKKVGQAEKKGRSEAEQRTTEHRNERKAKEHEKQVEEQDVAEFKKNPKAFQDATAAKEQQLEKLEEKLKKTSKTKKGETKADIKKLEKQIEDRKMIGYKASGGEIPESAWEKIKTARETWNLLHGREAHDEHVEAANENNEERSGHKANEAFEHQERRGEIDEIAGEDGAPVAETAERVEEMLSGLDGEQGQHDDEAGPDDDGAPDHQDVAPDHADAGPDGGGDDAQEGPAPDAAGAAAAAPAAAPEHAPAPAAKPPEPEVPELQYWPALVGKQGDFGHAQDQLKNMKLVAQAFRKAQMEARTKALETAETFGKYVEYGKQQQQQAKAHKGALEPTIADAGNSMQAAQKGGDGADHGSQQQSKGQAQGSGDPQEMPDAGPKPSHWHPFKRVLWYIKNWIAKKAGQALGWIQNKISSLILRAVCGVSMDDMKAYTAALHRRMEFSKLAGTQGVKAAEDTVGKAQEAETKSDDWGGQALNDAKDCDQNIQDVDAFSKDIETTEQDIANEQKRAVAFIAALKAEVTAERRRTQEEQQKKAAEAAKAKQPAAAAPAPSGGGAAAPGASRPPKGPKKPKKPPGKPAVAPAAIGKVRDAAGFVASQAHQFTSQLVSARAARQQRLAAALRAQPKALSEKLLATNWGQPVVDTFDTQAQQVADTMSRVQNGTPPDQSALHASAGQVRAMAKSLDDTAKEAHESLNRSFKAAYGAARREEPDQAAG